MSCIQSLVIINNKQSRANFFSCERKFYDTWINTPWLTNSYGTENLSWSVSIPIRLRDYIINITPVRL